MIITMKKIFASIALIVSVLASTGAFAAGTVNYNYPTEGQTNTNSITAPEDVSTYKTVMVKNNSTGTIVYIDQAESGFEAATNFLLKTGTDKKYGYYTATFGGAESGTPVSYSFVIGDVPIQESDQMTVADTAVIQEDGSNFWYKKGFRFDTTVDEYNKFNSIKLVDSSTSKCIGAVALPKCEISGKTEVAFGITVFNIPEQYKDTLVLYYSTDSVKDKEVGQ
jgi:hypothetical protein